MNYVVDENRLNQVFSMQLQAGGHADMSKGMCVMEAVSFVAGEPWSDTPECACPVISTFLRNWNDSLPDDERTHLLRDLIPRLVGTRGTEKQEQRRATMAADWLIRMHTPAWLRLANLGKQADLLERLPEITDFAQCPGLMPALEAVRTDAAAAMAAAWAAARDAAGAAARDAAWAAARAAAGDAAMAAAWDAAWDAARAAAGDAAMAAAGAAARDAAWAAARAAAGDAAMAAAWDAAWDAARAAAGDAAMAAAWAAARAAAWAAAGDALANTKKKLQQSAVVLVIRMIEEA